jgi:hypothetical protein
LGFLLFLHQQSLARFIQHAEPIDLQQQQQQERERKQYDTPHVYSRHTLQRAVVEKNDRYVCVREREAERNREGEQER